MLSKKDISAENLWQFAYTHEALLNNNIIEGIVLYFHGLGEQTLIKEHDENAKIFAEDNILYICLLYTSTDYIHFLSKTVNYLMLNIGLCF